MPKAHFIGICGTAMSATALLLKQSGWQISGSDEGFYPPISTYLDDNQIPYSTGYRAENIPKDVDLIVIGKHARLIPEDNEEVKAAFDSGKPINSYPEVLHKLTAQTQNYVIAGSFGKSTSTALAAWILESAGKDPSYMVGALSPSLSGNSKLGTGSDFVLEGDEYPSANWDTTSKFIYYNPNQLLLTSCEHDHVNIFPTLAEYLQPFRQLVSLTSLTRIVACLDGANIHSVLEGVSAPITTYSLRDASADWWAEDIRHDGLETSFELMAGQTVTGITTTMLGEHNIQNIVGVATLLIHEGGVTPTEFAAGVRSFKGVRRRLELKTPSDKVPLYEDFGSSRAKLLAGITAVRSQFPNRTLTVIFEPHTFSFRSRTSIAWYDDLFVEADSVYIYQPPTHGADANQLSLDEIVARVSATGTEVRPFASKEELLSLMPTFDPTHDVVLMETSGEMGGAIPALTELLQQ